MPEPDGSELQATAASEGRSERRVLTALCYDMVGSTDLLGQLDIEDFQDSMAAFQRAARQAISSFSGLARLEAGDGGIALFPLGNRRQGRSLARHQGRAGGSSGMQARRRRERPPRPPGSGGRGYVDEPGQYGRFGPLARQRRYRRGVCACDKAAGHCTARYGARFRRNAKPRAPVACIQLSGYPPDQGLRRAGTGLAGAQPQARIGSVLRLRPGERPTGRPCSRTGPDRGTLERGPCR